MFLLVKNPSTLLLIIFLHSPLMMERKMAICQKYGTLDILHIKWPTETQYLQGSEEVLVVEEEKSNHSESMLKNLDPIPKDSFVLKL